MSGIVPAGTSGIVLSPPFLGDCPFGTHSLINTIFPLCSFARYLDRPDGVPDPSRHVPGSSSLMLHQVSRIPLFSSGTRDSLQSALHLDSCGSPRQVGRSSPEADLALDERQS